MFSCFLLSLQTSVCVCMCFFRLGSLILFLSWISLHLSTTLGDNGTIDGQGSVWWDWFSSHSLKYSRPHLVEFVDSKSVVISNLTFLNAPAYSIHPVYCRFVRLKALVTLYFL